MFVTSFEPIKRDKRADIRLENASIQQESMIIRQQAEEHTTEDDEEDVDLLVDQLKNEEDGIKIGETKMEERTPAPSPTTKKDKPRTKST